MDGSAAYRAADRKTKQRGAPRPQIKESESVFKKFTNGCVRVVNRWLPDAFLFAIILSIIVFIGAMFATGMGPLKVLNAWGDAKGFWGLLAFSMQMALVLVFGSAMASAKPCRKALRAVAGLCHNNMQAIVITTMVSTICCWLNWGFGRWWALCWPRKWSAAFPPWTILC